MAAVAELKEAIALDPANAVAAANIAYVRQLMGEAGGAAVAQPAAAGEMNEAAPMAMAAAGDNGSAAPPENSADPVLAPAADIVQAAASPDAAPPAPVAENTSHAEASEAVPDVAAALTGRNIRIEVANGTRNAWLTGSVARMLSGSGLKVTRTENLKPYTQRRTVILYREGYREEALALARSFAMPPAVAKDTHVRNPMHKFELRLVLGKTALQVTQLAQKDAGGCDGGGAQCKP